MGAKSAPPPPDTSKYSNAAYKQSQLMQDWGKQLFDSGQQQWDQIRSWGEGFMGQVMPAMEDMFGWAAQNRDNYERLTMPAMESMFRDAEEAASTEAKMQARAQAAQDVGAAMEAKREAHQRRLREAGVDISELAGASLDKQGGIQEGAAQALAMNQAGTMQDMKADALRAQAVNAGQTFAGQYAQGMGMGAGLGQTGLKTYTGAANIGMGLSGQAMPFMSGSYQGIDLGAGIVDTAYGRELQRTELNNAAQAQNFSQAMAVGQSVGQMAAVADGGPVLAPGGPTDDAGAVAISDGEYVIPADVVKKLGTNYFDKMIEKETGRPPPAMKQAVPIPSHQPGETVPQTMAAAPTGAGILR